MDVEQVLYSENFLDHIAKVIACYVLAYMTYYFIIHRLVDLQNCKEHSKVNGQEKIADYASIIERLMVNMYPDSKIVVYGYPKSAEAKGLSKLLLINQKNLEAKNKLIQEKLKRKKH